MPDMRRFTVVVGENAAGKTAFLEALFVAGAGSAEIYVRADAWRGRDKIRVSLGKTEPQLQALFEDFFYKFDINLPIIVRFMDSNKQERRAILRAQPAGGISLPFDTKIDVRSNERGPTRELKFSWKGPEGEFDSPIEVTEKGLAFQAPRHVYEMAMVNYSTALAPEQNAERYSELSSKNKEQPIVKAVKKLFPAIENLEVLAPFGLPSIHAVVRGMDHKIPVGLLSAGITKIIGVLVNVAAFPEGTILVDEIENGLHYKQYAGVWSAVAECAGPRTQIIATTHSAEFLRAIAPEAKQNQDDYCFIRAERVDEQCVLKSFSGKEFVAAIDQGFEVR